ncbi:MAG: hypothetical protein JOZ99_06160 [Actinobacteria bacterium]|nr:hypothetical protein [Actinomycetota bacterium]
MKYRHARAAVPWLAAAMVSALEERAIGDVDVVTWPPTTPARRRHRGFDHARVLAVEVAGRLRRPAAPLLVRQGGDPQTGRPALQRRTGGPRFVARSAPERVLLVDDHHGRHAGRSGRSPPPGRLRLGRGGYRDAHSTTALSGRTIHHPGVISRHAVDTARTVLHRAARSARGMGPS